MGNRRKIKEERWGGHGGGGDMWWGGHGGGGGVFQENEFHANLHSSKNITGFGQRLKNF